MHYGSIKPLDIANGPGIRVSLFVSGCRNHCKGCFQPETWAFNYGRPFDKEAMSQLLERMKNPHVSGLSILGGDPFEPENLPEVTNLCEFVHYHYPGKTIWVWTGYRFEDLRHLEIMGYIDVLVDGPFIQELKDLRLHYRGSSNQRVIDVKTGSVLEFEKE